MTYDIDIKMTYDIDNNMNDDLNVEKMVDNEIRNR